MDLITIEQLQWVPPIPEPIGIVLPITIICLSLGLALWTAKTLYLIVLRVMTSEQYEAFPQTEKRKNSDAEYQYSEDEWYEDEKPKRRGYFEIGDDGELIEVFEDEG